MQVMAVRSETLAGELQATAREVREQMRLGGIEVVVGSTNFHERVTDGVRAWEQTGQG
jgi:hypothetical protein